MGAVTVRTLARGYLKWVAQVIPADTRDEDLLAMRFRALDLGSYTPSSGQGAFVPILPASDYEASVKRYWTTSRRSSARSAKTPSRSTSASRPS